VVAHPANSPRFEVRTGVRTRRAFPASLARPTRSTMRVSLNHADVRGAYGIQTPLQTGMFPAGVAPVYARGERVRCAPSPSTS
jgi:hypothetical protein